MRTTESDLPIPDYDHRDVQSIVDKLRNVTPHELQMINAYETKHKNRVGVHTAVDHQLASRPS